jgi:hypothetical protein
MAAIGELEDLERPHIQLDSDEMLSELDRGSHVLGRIQKMREQYAHVFSKYARR